MRTITVFILTLFFITNLRSQNTDTLPNSEYSKLVTTAFENLTNGDCKACLDKFETAAKMSPLNVLNNLRAALCAYECKNRATLTMYLNAAFDTKFEKAEDILHKGYPEFDKYRSTLFYKMVNEKLEAATRKARI